METQSGYIAVIDDDKSAGISLCRLLHCAGFKAIAFTSGEQFIRFAMYHNFDSVILDIHMPGLDGFQVQDRLEEIGIMVPIVFITALGDPDVQVRAMSKGSAGYLQKPFKAKALLEAISAAIKSKGKMLF